MGYGGYGLMMAHVLIDRLIDYIPDCIGVTACKAGDSVRASAELLGFSLAIVGALKKKSHDIT